MSWEFVASAAGRQLFCPNEGCPAPTLLNLGDPPRFLVCYKWTCLYKGFYPIGIDRQIFFTTGR